ncbi:acetate--CoA ligase family protein [Rhodococcus sp. T2V]|uniref:acetate--CoA ligase family protein n=1 Tax=Rhodococcus sp. T2V TaxID=3034164 RepID=UPI0023E2DED6|nr:acetate--CoA ligase family protein [Rhodococcus sp. T2V]MDF3311465.1 acetate--CoA ligase family protein [Rhodococcus sp. T2V]
MTDSSPQGLLRPLLYPDSVAIVGASDDPNKTTGRPQRFLSRAGFSGATYFVNPSRKTVQGEKAWPSLGSLPRVPDHVFIMTGPEAAIAAVRECATLGVSVATVLSSGFAEDGAAGRERQERLRAAAAAGGVRVIGPSSLGVVNPGAGVLLTGNAAFGEPDTPCGGVFVASQSGSVIGALVSRARGRGVGFAGLVSTGGEADLSLGAICETVLDDPHVTSYALFLESLRHSADLASFARAADQAGKPVAVYKLGRSDEAAALAVSHTGAMAGEDAEADAFFRACGFARVSQFEGLVEAPALLERIPAGSHARDPRIGVVTTTGGGAALVVEQLALRGMTVAAPSENLVTRMHAAGAPIPHSLIADLGLAGARRDIVTDALRLMQDSGEFDLVVFVIGSSARLNPELAVQAVADHGRHTVPVVAFAVPEAPEAAMLLNSSGVPTFRTPESCADVIAATFGRRPCHLGLGPAPVPPGPTEVVDEHAAAELIGRRAIATPPSTVLDLADLDGPIELPFDFPVVVKALSDQLPHKTEAGGVVLGVEDAGAVRVAAKQIAAAVAAHNPDIALDRVLVQQMATGGVAETLVGYRVSQDVGPIVVLSTGGVMAEIFADSSVRLAPVTLDTAHEMIRDVKGLAAARGYRGTTPGDLDALARTIVGMSELAIYEPDVHEAEVNPLLVHPQGGGVVALDALVRRTAGAHGGKPATAPSARGTT